MAYLPIGIYFWTKAMCSQGTITLATAHSVHNLRRALRTRIVELFHRIGTGSVK